MKKIKVLIVDDHDMIREVFKAKFKQSKNIITIGTAENGKDALKQIKILSPNVILMDLRMPEMDGIEATKIIVRDFPNIKILILSSFDDIKSIIECLIYGANGYILKSAPLNELFTAIDSISNGRTYFSKRVTEVLLEKLDSISPDMNKIENRQKKLNDISKYRLSKREIEVLSLLAQGLINKQIADQLNIKTSTVGKYREKIMIKLDMHSVADLTRFAMQNNII